MMRKILLYRLINLSIFSIIFAFIGFLRCTQTNPLTVELIEITNITEETLELSYDIGDIPKNGEIIKKDFTLVNKTEETIIIYYVMTSCTCTIVVLEDDEGNISEEFDKTPGKIADIELKKDESITIHVSFDQSEEELGDGYKMIYIYNDYNEITIEIEISYNIIE